MRDFRRKEAGFTLIEVLITVAVMSFALLGLAGLQITALKNNQSAHQRAQATLLAYDAADRMRGNRNEALAGNYDTLITDPAPSGTSMLATDVASWKNALAATLPSGNGSIATDTATGIVTILVQWDDSRGSGGATSEQWTMETQL